MSFLAALLCLLIGVGCFKGNLASQVGALYAPNDLRRADAYQIYYMAISAGVIISPLITGTLGELYGWHYGFAAAGIGMLIGLGTYLSGRRWLPSDRAVAAIDRQPRRPLSRRERTTVVVLVLLLPVLAIGTVGNQEIFNAYLLWAPTSIDMVFFGHTMLTTWLIAVDAAVGITFLAGSVAFWRVWAARFREPSEISKLIVGFAISFAAQLALVAASAIAATGHKASIGWLLAFEVLNSIGFANVLPVGLALYARAAPVPIAATMIGVYFLHLFMANNFVGWLGGLLERLPGTLFWGLHATLVATAGLLMLAAGRALGPLLAPGSATTPAAARAGR